MNFSPFRTALVVIVSLVGILFALPNVLPADWRAALPDWLPKQQVTLGLDLQGGSHLLLQVNREDIVSERIKELRRDARSVLASDNGIGNIITTTDNGIEIELTDPAQRDAAVAALQSLQNNLGGAAFGAGGVPELSFGDGANGRIAITLTSEGVDQRMSSLVAQSIEVIRNRIDELGTTEPTIQRQGNDRVLVQVPGFDDSTRLKDIISRTARLTFHLVHPRCPRAGGPRNSAGYMILPVTTAATS